MAGKPGQVKEDARFRILRLLEDNPSLSQRELAQTVGISVGAVNYVLNALVEKGLVKLGNFSAAPDKRRYAYILTRKGLLEKAAMTRGFLKRKKAEYEALKSEIEALEAEINNGATSRHAKGR